ncbi:MAG: MFS transporter, partial [Candidatus Thorarchaeota archaeon]|nr:MFS transporter [Candidatus Thorarchaeota archaeon]
TLMLPKNSASVGSPPSIGIGSTLRDVRCVLSSPSFLLATFATFTLFFIRTGVRTTLVPLFAGNNLGLDTSAIGLILTLAAISTAITMVPMGRLSDRIGRRNPLAVCLLLTAFATLLIPFSVDYLTISVNLIVYGAFVGFSGPMAAYVTDLSPPDKIEVSMGLYRMISDIGFVVGPLLLGYVSDITATPVPGETHIGAIGVLPFVVAAALLFVSGLSLLRAADPVRQRRDAPQSEPHP